MIVPMVGSPLTVPDGPQGVAVLGSTGSIGRQTLDVIARLPERFRVVALAAGSPSPLFAEQIAASAPAIVVVDGGADAVHASGVRVFEGPEGLVAAATDDAVDIVVVATSGHAAIIPTARAIEAGKTVALANKESIVCAGDLIAAICRRHGATIRPVDSEHCAIWQSLGRSNGGDLERLILTASGGPFRDKPRHELMEVTVDAALAHPTWAMGAKITIDSATLMNKGLEVIEAHVLFGVPYERIDVVVHPESIVHSLVEFADGSQVAQLGYPDMRLPIQYALTYPEHAPGPYRRLSLADVGALHFSAPDDERFPALRLARHAGMAGDTYPTVLSAADDVAVKAFGEGRIGFLAIAEVVERSLAAHAPWAVSDFDAVAQADRWATATAESVVRQIAARR